MSAERGRTGTLAAVLLVVAVIAAAAWALLPRRLSRVTVESAVLLPPGKADDSRKAPPLATPTRIAVTFSTPDDLPAARARLGMDYIAARLAGCRGGAAHTQEVVTQGAGYLLDHGRVRRLAPGPDGHARYRAVFDDRLSQIVGHESREVPALSAPGGLCFRLWGARMWFGSARSAAVPVTPG